MKLYTKIIHKKYLIQLWFKLAKLKRTTKNVVENIKWWHLKEGPLHLEPSFFIQGCCLILFHLTL